MLSTSTGRTPAPQPRWLAGEPSRYLSSTSREHDSGVERMCLLGSVRPIGGPGDVQVALETDLARLESFVARGGSHHQSEMTAQDDVRRAASGWADGKCARTFRDGGVNRRRSDGDGIALYELHGLHGPDGRNPGLEPTKPHHSDGSDEHRHIAKVRVASSNLVVRSIETPAQRPFRGR